MTMSQDRYESARRNMVDWQLAGRDIRDKRVIEAMLAVPREEFVSPSDRSAAYDDFPLSIGHGQTISQPYTVAYMAQAAKLGGQERVLEIGTGSGYGAAVLSKLARSVVTIERIGELGKAAAERLAKLGYDNVEVRVGDGTLGCPERAPYDAIVVTAGGENLPPALAEQLAEEGRCIIPVGPTRQEQQLMRYTRRGRELFAESLGSFAFVPLIGEAGWKVENT